MNVDLGFHTVHFSPMFGGTTPLPEVLAATAAAGFDLIGFDMASIDAFVAAGGSVDALVELLATLDLRCSDLLVLAAGGDDPDIVATAIRMGSLADRLHPAWAIAAQSGAVPRDVLVSDLRSCAAVVADHGMRLAIEFAPYSALTSLELAGDLCAAVGWDRAALVLDSLHAARAATPLAELAQLDASKIALVQFSDAPAVAPGSLRDESRNGRLVPGDGGLALGSFVDAVRATGYDGLVSSEVLSESFRRADPLAGATAARRALEAAWSSEVADPRRG